MLLFIVSVFACCFLWFDVFVFVVVVVVCCMLFMIVVCLLICVSCCSLAAVYYGYVSLAASV